MSEIKNNPDNINLPDARDEMIRLEKEAERRMERLKAKKSEEKKKRKPTGPEPLTDEEKNIFREKSLRRQELTKEEQERVVAIANEKEKEDAIQWRKRKEEEREELVKELGKVFDGEKKNQESPKDSERVVDLREEVQGEGVEEITARIKATEKEIEKRKKEILETEEQIKKLQEEAELKPDNSIEKAEVESQIEVKNNRLDQLRGEAAMLEGDLNQLTYYKKSKEEKLGSLKYAKKAGIVGLGILAFGIVETFKTGWDIIKVTAAKAWEEFSKLTGVGGFWEDCKKMFKRFLKRKKET